MKPAASLRALLAHVIDYAGMFPPASLSLDESIRNFARYVGEPDSWMLGRFICPAGKLEALLSYLPELFDAAKPLQVCVLARGGATPDEFRAALAQDQVLISAFYEQASGRAALSGLEARSTAIPKGFESGGIFLEAPQPVPGAGFKLRTGGVEASVFPTAEQIAVAMATCRDKQIPMKFTAGLHHPIRHFNSSVNTKMHGFINVFVAGVIAHSLRLHGEQLVRILLDEDASSFAFNDDELRWRDYRATTRQVADARKQLVTSFGSCSFDEPRDDLRSLGWL